MFQLEEALLGLSQESGDAHISDLVSRCKEIEAADAKGTESVEGGSSAPLHKAGGTEEQEEVEK